MTGLGWTYLKAFVLAAIVAVAALFIALTLKGLQANPILMGVASLAPWIALAGFVAALLLIAVPVWRVWLWQRGAGPICHRCGGPLGHELKGRYGPYRPCLACHGNTSERYYT